MRPVKIIFFIIVLSFLKRANAQEFASTYKPKTKTDRLKLVLAKVKALPEVKEWYQTAKKSDPDMEISPPDSTSKYYRIQVGLGNLGMFRTNYWLSVDPKTLQLYYIDFDDEGMQDITLEQWRYWRNKPQFKKVHKWVDGKIVVLEEEKHVKKKSSRP